MRSSTTANDVWTAVRVARLGGIAALVVTSLGAILLLPDPLILLYLIPAVSGGVMSIRWGRSALILFLAAALIVTTAYLFMFGGYGLLYVPSVIFLIVGAALNLKSPKPQQPA